MIHLDFCLALDHMFPGIQFGREMDFGDDLVSISIWKRPESQPTSEQINVALQAVLAKKTAEAAILAQQAEGFDTGRGFRLAMGDSDVQAFTQMTVLVQTALTTGAIMPDSPQRFADREGVLRTLGSGEFIAMMLAYGMAVKGLWDAKKQAGI